jgi:conjugal transfer pilus assembly protein TraE
MLFDFYLQKTSNLVGENRLLKFFIVLIGVAVVVNSFYVHKAMNQQRTVIIPVGGLTGDRLEFQGDVLSDSYVRLMTRYVMGLFMDYTPDSANGQYSELLESFSSGAYPEYKEKLTTLADDIKTTKVSGSFSIQKITHHDGNVIDVSGIKKQFLESSLASDEVVTYRIKYEVVNGMFRLVEINEVSDKA